MASNKKALLDHVFNLQVQGDQLSRKIFEQRQVLKELEEKVDVVQEEIRLQQERRKEADARGGGVNASKSLQHSHQKKLSILENRLAAARQRQSETLTENANFKERIDRRREVRIAHDEIYQKFQRQLKEYTEMLDKAMESSDQIMQDRDALVGQTEDLIALAREEKRAFKEIYDELTELIEAQKKETEKFWKESQTITFDLPAQRATARSSILITKNQDNGSTAREEGHAHKRIEATPEQYEQAFASILSQYPGIDDYEVVKEKFLQKEEEMMKLMKEIQMTNDEISVARDQIELITAEKENYLADLTQGAVDVRRRFAEKMVKSKTQIEEESQQFAQLREEKLAGFHNVIKMCERMFGSIGCADLFEVTKDGPKASKSPAAMRKGTSSALSRPQAIGQSMQSLGINENNVAAYMEIIEERANQIIEEYIKYQADNFNQIPKNALAPPSFGLQQITPPLPIPQITEEISLFPQAQHNVKASTTTVASFDASPPHLSSPRALAHGGEDLDLRPLTKEELVTQAAVEYQTLITTEMQHGDRRSRAVPRKR